jgi:hypothetical protein
VLASACSDLAHVAAQKTYEKQCGLYFLTDRQAIDVAGKAALVEQQKRQLGSKEQKS